jgi:hypothetical protein
MHVESFDHWKGVQTADAHNALFERLAAVKTHRGFSVGIKNPELWKTTIAEDANRIAHNDLHKDLAQISSAEEFVGLVNLMIEHRMRYDHLSTKETSEGKAESDRLNAMPIDELYLEGSGVCRHYAALAEEISTVLSQEHLTPNVHGVAIRELGSNEINHAWNVVLLNPSGKPGEVVIGFTDVTHDQYQTQTLYRGPALSRLEALDADHDSLSSFTTDFLRTVPFLLRDQDVRTLDADYKGRAELEEDTRMNEVLEELVRQHVGGLEEVGMAAYLAVTYSGQGTAELSASKESDVERIRFDEESVARVERRLAKDEAHHSKAIEQDRKWLAEETKTLEEGRQQQKADLHRAEESLRKSVAYSLRAAAAGREPYNLAGTTATLLDAYRQSGHLEAVDAVVEKVRPFITRSEYDDLFLKAIDVHAAKEVQSADQK